MNRKKICLNMIVKNENEVIERCLSSVKPLIDYWVIVDTGSTDETQQIIETLLKDIPGELHRRPWVDFAHNRNEAAFLARGKGDYLLFIDADDQLVFSEQFTLPQLDKDIYLIIQKEGDDAFAFSENRIVFLIKNNSDFEWNGVLHERINLKKEEIKTELVSGIHNQYNHDGHRSKDPHRLKKDIEMLKKGILKEPNNSRYLFFLGRTYLAMKDYASALYWFEKRAKVKGGPQELYQTLLHIAMAHEYLDASPEVVLHSFSQAFLNRPTRAEPLYQLAIYLISRKQFFQSYLVCKFALTIPMPQENLYVEPWVYDWGIPLYLFLSSSQLPFAYEEACTTLHFLLNHPKLPLKVVNDFNLNEASKIFGIKYA